LSSFPFWGIRVQNSAGLEKLNFGPYSKGKLELNSKRSRTRVMQKCLAVLISLFLHLKPDVRYSDLSFIRLSWSKTTDKLAINWQNFAQVGLQLKFAFKIWLFVLLKLSYTFL